jgi:hypothetical protein
MRPCAAILVLNRRVPAINFVHAAARKHHHAGFAIEAVQPLVDFGADTSAG